MAGTVDLVLRCLTGMRPGGEVLEFDPVLLPPEIKSVSFSVHHRGRRVAITLTGDYLSVSARPGDRSPVSIAVGEDLRELAPGMQAVFRLGRERHVRDTS